MRTLQNLGVVSSIAIASVATAQNAVEWRVADGGNGHWYQRIPRGDLSWSALKLQCESQGGHLVSITTRGESAVCTSAMAGERCITGGFQDHSSPNYVEPAGGWRWCTGEPIVWSNWQAGEPNDYFSWGEEIMGAYPNGYWVDLSDRPGDLGWPVAFALIEFDADCNNDGLVDYGQILAGTLADANHNNLPDTCEHSPCPGDITRNGVVDGVDLALILATWGTNGAQGNVNADVNRDGIVNGTDLSLVLGSWGGCL